MLPNARIAFYHPPCLPGLIVPKLVRFEPLPELALFAGVPGLARFVNTSERVHLVLVLFSAHFFTCGRQ